MPLSLFYDKITNYVTNIELFFVATKSFSTNFAFLYFNFFTIAIFSTNRLSVYFFVAKGNSLFWGSKMGVIKVLFGGVVKW